MISPYRKPEYLFCSLDVVNAACYLAFLEPEEAKMMSFTPEYFYARRKIRRGRKMRTIWSVSLRSQTT